jgi:hypothetical protein
MQRRIATFHRIERKDLRTTLQAVVFLGERCGVNVCRDFIWSLRGSAEEDGDEDESEDECEDEDEEEARRELEEAEREAEHLAKQGGRGGRNKGRDAQKAKVQAKEAKAKEEPEEAAPLPKTVKKKWALRRRWGLRQLLRMAKRELRAVARAHHHAVAMKRSIEAKMQKQVDDDLAEIRKTQGAAGKSKAPPHLLHYSVLACCLIFFSMPCLTV